MSSSLKLFNANKAEIPLKIHQFSDGARHIQILKSSLKNEDKYHIHISGNSHSQIITDLFLLKTALDQMLTLPRLKVFMPYLPYAREDRVCANGQSFGLSYFARSFNLFFPKSTLYLLDVHNKKSLELFNQANSINSTDYIANHLSNSFSNSQKICGLITPDKGALPRVNELALSLKTSSQDSIVYCDKLRDMNSGKILKFTVSRVQKEFTDLFLYDDICDGGGTFIACANEIKKQLPTVKLHLIVTHGIFSKGLEQLKEHFSISCLNFIGNEKLKDQIHIIKSWQNDFYAK